MGEKTKIVKFEIRKRCNFYPVDSHSSIPKIRHRPGKEMTNLGLDPRNPKQDIQQDQQDGQAFYCL